MGMSIWIRVTLKKVLGLLNRSNNNNLGNQQENIKSNTLNENQFSKRKEWDLNLNNAKKERSLKTNSKICYIKVVYLIILKD
jgi:hypothetical protein